MCWFFLDTGISFCHVYFQRYSQARIASKSEKGVEFLSTSLIARKTAYPGQPGTKKLQKQSNKRMPIRVVLGEKELGLQVKAAGGTLESKEGRVGIGL